MEHVHQVLDKLLLYKQTMNCQDVPLISAIATAVVILLTLLYYRIKNRGVPPGPKGVPYLGLYPYLTEEKFHLQLDEHKKKYGDVFSFTYTGRLFINLGSIKAIRDFHISKSDCFAERFQDTNVLVEMLRNGVFYIKGEKWKLLRKFFIQKFKDYGLSTVRENNAGPVYDSLNKTIEDLRATGAQPVNIVELLAQRCTVTMRRILFGERGVTDEELGNMTMAFAKAIEGTLGILMLAIGPFARMLFLMQSGLRSNLKHHRILIGLIRKCAKKIEASMSDDDATCLIEEFYKERNTRRKRNDPTWKYFTDETLAESVLQFVGDGILTISAFIAGTLNELLEHPEEQERVYAELMDVVGTNRQPVAEDKINLPYTNAFINEVIRKSVFLRFFPSMECTKETTIAGYRIPKGSITLLNFWSAHHDPKTYRDPVSFNPSRFIASGGKPKEDSPVIFGVGKRSCSGEAFVMLQCFLFMATIAKNFKVVSSNASSEESLDFLLSGKLELTFVPRADH